MLIDETIDHPMTFFLRAHLVGRVHVDELAAAFSQVVHRHPIFWSTVVRRENRLSWKMVPERMPTLSVRHTTLGHCHLKSHIDLEHEPGIRAQLTINGNDAELWLQFHHSCSDGISGIRFLDECFEVYRQRVSGRASSAHCETGRFPLRRCAFENLSRGASTKRLTRDLARIWAFLRRRMVDLEHPSVGPRVRRRTATPSFLEARLPFTSTTMGRIKRTQPMVPTVNDVLLRDIYLALGDWMRIHQCGKHGRWIRILAPTNMRHPDTEESRCHNDLGMVFLDRRWCLFQDQAKLLHGISKEMTQIKQNKMGHAFLRALGWGRAFPGGMAFAKKLRRAYATVVVSNLGNVLGPAGAVEPVKIGDFTVDGLGFLVPIRHGTPVSFGVLTHARELTIAMQYDDAVFNHHSAQQLLTCVVGRLCSSFGLGEQRSPRDGTRRAA